MLDDLQRAFARLGVRWFPFGAQAAILYGVARLSMIASPGNVARHH